jgi:hypothetical protein
MTRFRLHLTYANVMATIAVFVALGGTSYAVMQLPKNSVGSKQIRANAVGASEIRKSTVRSSEIKDRSVALRDISRGARDRLRGQTGPVGPQGAAGPPAATLSAAVRSGGDYARSNGTSQASTDHRTEGVYRVDFNRDLNACYVAATISTVRANTAGGEILTEIIGASVHVRTSESNGTLKDLPFHLLISC